MLASSSAVAGSPGASRLANVALPEDSAANRPFSAVGSSQSRRIWLVGDRSEYSEIRVQCATLNHSITSASTRSDFAMVSPRAVAPLGWSQLDPLYRSDFQAYEGFAAAQPSKA